MERGDTVVLELWLALAVNAVYNIDMRVCSLDNNDKEIDCNGTICEAAGQWPDCTAGNG